MHVFSEIWKKKQQIAFRELLVEREFRRILDCRQDNSGNKFKSLPTIFQSRKKLNSVLYRLRDVQKYYSPPLITSLFANKDNIKCLTEWQISSAAASHQSSICLIFPFSKNYKRLQAIAPQESHTGSSEDKTGCLPERHYYQGKCSTVSIHIF